MNSLLIRQWQKNEAYISPQMREIINMTDTAKSPIPLEKLIPSITNDKLYEGRNYIVRVLSRTDDDSVILKGYDDVVKLYSKQKTYISKLIAERFNIKVYVDKRQKIEDYPDPTKAYYVTCYAITKTIKYSVPKDILPDKYSRGIVIGINPDSLNTFGFHVTDRYKKRNYVFTTYVWSIVDDPDPKSGEGGYYYPQTPANGGGFSAHGDLYMFADHMQWAFAAYDI